jgi:DNA-binding CsgD family transcriptional regulator
VDAIGSSIIDFTEAAYDLELSDEEWLPTILERGLPVLDQGLGLAGQEYCRPPDGGQVVLTRLHVPSGPTDFAERHIRALSTIDANVLRKHLRPGCASTASAATKNNAEELAHYVSHVDHCKDILFFTAVSPSGAGVAIIAPLAKVTTLSRQDTQRWQMLAAHVETGHRLRQGLRALDPDEERTDEVQHDAEAIFEARNFRLVDLAGRARDGAAKKKLREAALTVDRARGRMRDSDTDKALEIWKALAQGRWSIVDWFDSDGRRFVLAIPNSPELGDPRGLTERESQVVAEAVMGHTNKMIAYRLGLSTGHVSLLLCSSMRKLGVRKRAQLVEKMSSFPTLQ